MKSAIQLRPGWSCTCLALLLVTLGWTLSVSAQEHGVGIRKVCLTAAKVGDTASCTMRVINEDEFGDAIEVLEFWDLVGTGADQFRVPTTGNLPIIQISSDQVTCAADPEAPIGLTFPCILPGVPGGSEEFVRVRSTYTVPDWAEDPLLDQANAIVRDICDVQPIGCNPNPQLQQFGAAVSLFEASLEVSKTGPDTAKVGDEICYEIGFIDTSTGTGFPGFENCTGSDTVLGDLGAFVAGQPREFCHTTSATDPNPLLNTATITCGVVGFDNELSDSDDHSVDLIDPSVSLTKQCHPDPVLVGETIHWSIQVDNTGGSSLDCLLNDPDAGFIDEAFSLGAGQSETFNASRLAVLGDAPLISNTASVSCDVAGFDNQVSDEDSADCAVEIPGEEVCRTPGFWGTHGGTEHPRSTNLTQLVIDAAGGELHVCGTTVSDTDVGSYHSAIEAMCVRVGGLQQRQLARQLTAMALNCVISSGAADCAGTSVEGLFADANAACAADDGDLGNYIERVDCFNNGGQWNGGEGTCSIDPEDPNNCQNRDLDFSTDIFDGVSPLPGPAGSSRACNAASRNDVYIVP